MGTLRRGGFRAGRRTWLRLGGISLLLLLLIFAITRFVGLPPSQAPSPIPPETPAVEVDQASLVTVEDTVRTGDTFSGLLLRNRLGMQDISRILTLTRQLQLFSPRSLRPGQLLTLDRDDYGRLARMSLQLSPEETWVYETQNDSLVAHLLPVERTVRLRKFEGEIETTFDDAIHKAGGDYRLTFKVADVFAYDVDFFTEVHKGDRFSLLVEERFADGRSLGYGEILYGRYDGAKAHTMAYYLGPEGRRRGGYYDELGQATRKAFLRSPLNYRRITSFFSAARFHPILKTWRPHHGVDYAAAIGTPVVAVADGTIQFAGWSGGFGQLIRLRHAGRTETAYGHLSRFAQGISTGAHVRQGEVIGFVGRTGLATGPHLHYEVAEGGRQMNPLQLKNLPADPIPVDQMASFRDYAAQLQELDQALLAGQVLESFEPARVQVALAQLNSAGIPPVR